MKWFEFVLFLAAKRRTLILNFLVTLPVAFLIAFSMPKYYKSEISFLPPEQNSGLGLAGLLSGGGMSLPGADLMDNYYNLNTSHIKLILESAVIRTSLIHQFDLIHSYNLKKSKKPYTDALLVLKKRIEVEEVEKSGLGFSDVVGFTVSMSDTSAKRAYEMLNFYFAEVQKTVNSISNEKAKRVKNFSQDLLEKNRKDLVMAEGKLLEFQLKNKVLDLPAQMRESVKAYSDLKATLMMKTMDLNLKKDDFQDGSRSTYMLANEINQLKREIEALENKRSADYMVGLNMAPELFYQFIELSKSVETYQKLDVLLIQTCEFAKIQEVKSLASLQVIDPPTVAEYKYKPKRSLIILAILCLEMGFVVCLLFISYLYKTSLTKNDDFSKLLSALKTNH